ncbi:M16 family metallopeptidase [Sorangium sp. So ce1078]|uniref:M16 family metallopeptidase n=1 Tax=Sorangium sp. So ce1078 TaxID=3133329 RepID=UPI003F6136FD
MSQSVKGGLAWGAEGQGRGAPGGRVAPRDGAVLVETSHALPLVSIVVAFRSGAAHDPVGREGLARITARMLRRGAEGYSANEIEETIDALGGEFGADVATSATTVHFEVIKRSLDRFIELGATLLARPTFSPPELARLLREAEAELIEARDSDRSLCSRAFRRTLFAGHPYGRRIAGTIPTLREITRDDVAAFYARHYTRRNAIVAISGDIEPGEAQRVAERLLSGLPEGEAIPDPVTEPGARPGRCLVFVDKPERTQTQMVIGGLGTDAHDPDHMALLVANTVFGGTFSSRLMQEVRAKRGWSYGASSRAGFDRHRDAFTMWTAPAAQDAAACLSLELGLLEALRRDGITEDELTFVKRYLVRSHAFEIDTARKRVHQKLEEILYDLPEGYHETYLKQVEGVSLDEANAAVRRRISEDDLVIGVVGTHAEIGEAVAAAIPKLAEVKVEPYDLE